MSEQLKLDYYYGIEADQFSFFRIPKILIKDKRFKELSSDAVLLYSMMLDRMQLSRKNGWLDEQNRAYIYYTVEDAIEDLGRSRPTIIKVMKELDSVDGIGLIERRKPGQGRPAIIYVKNFATLEPGADVDNSSGVKKVDFQKSKNFTSESKDSELQGVKESYFRESRGFTSSGKDSELQEVSDFDPNNTEYIKTENSHIENSKNKESYNEMSDSCPVKSCLDDDDDSWMDHMDFSKPIKLTMAKAETQKETGQDGQDLRNAYIEMIRDQVYYDNFRYEEYFKHRMDMIDGIISIIADIAVTDPPDGIEWVNKRPYSHEVVKSRLLKIDSETLRHVVVKLSETTTKIHSLRNYIITALYNAKDEAPISVQNDVMHDMYGGGWAEKGII